MAKRPAAKLTARERRRARRVRGPTVVKIVRPTVRTWTRYAPDAGAALATIEAGERPDDATLRAALHQLRTSRREILARGFDGANTEVLRYLDDHIDVFRWCLTQPVGQRLRLCVSCGRRSARVDDLCKRCADVAGNRPRGKIT